MLTTIVLYRHGKNWRWRLIDDRSKKIIGASTEGYRRRIDALKNLRRVTCYAYSVPKKATARIFKWKA